MKKFVLLAAVLLSFGCIKKKDDDGVVKTGKISSEFHGTWEGCIVDGSDSIMVRQVISETAVAHSETFYDSNTVCLASAKIVKIDSYHVVKKQNPLTLKMTSTTVTPLIASMTTNFNNNFLCAYQQWSTGVAHDVTGWDCGNDLDFSDSEPFVVNYAKNGNTLTVDDGDGNQFTLTLVP